MERQFKGIWIPKEIWLNEKMTMQEKVFFAEIESLDSSKERGCYASNSYFAKFFQLSKSRCSEIISSLKNKGLISVSMVRKNGHKDIEERQIKVVGKRHTPIRFPEAPIRETGIPYSGKAEDSNTDNNTNNNESVKEDLPSPSFSDSPPPQTNQGMYGREAVVPTKMQVWEVFQRMGGTKEMAKKFYDNNEATGWYFKGSPIIKFENLANSFIGNWKQIEENQTKKTTPSIPPPIKKNDTDAFIAKRKADMEAMKNAKKGKPMDEFMEDLKKYTR